MNNYCKLNIILFLAFLSFKSFGFMFGFGDSVKYEDVPESIEECISEVFSHVDNGTELSLSTLKKLGAFVLSTHTKTKAWELEKRWEAEGAGITAVFPYELEKCVPLYFSANVPDYSIFFPLLRYSTKINFDNFLSVRERCIISRPKTNTMVTGSYTCTESITPNLQTGACFSYTNTRTLIRGNINGNDILVSMSKMHSPSTYSTRGITVGPPENNLYYFSDKEGINLTGLKWVRSRMYVSRTMAIYVKGPKNQTVIMIFTWMAAGWNNINVIKTKNIYRVLQQSIKLMGLLAEKQSELDKSLPKIMDEMNKMDENDVNKLFKLYCDYVSKCIKQGAGENVTSKQAKLLRNLYDKKTLDAMPLKYRKSLIIQEKVRRLSLIHI